MRRRQRRRRRVVPRRNVNQNGPAQVPVAQQPPNDGRIEERCEYPTAEWQVKYLEKMFPSLRIVVRPLGAASHPRIRLAFSEAYAASWLIGKAIRKHRANDNNPVLVVGTYESLRRPSRVHVCEGRTDPISYTRKQDLGPMLVNGQRQAGDRFTWCSHHVGNCTCFGIVHPRLALFVNTAGHYDKEAIAAFIRATQLRTAYIVHYVYEGAEGHFHSYEGSYEAAWRRQKPTGLQVVSEVLGYLPNIEPPKIELDLKGSNQRLLLHDHKWLTEPFTEVTNGILVPTPIPFDTSGITRVTRVVLAQPGTITMPTVAPVKEFKISEELGSDLARYIPRAHRGLTYLIRHRVVVAKEPGTIFPLEMASRLEQYLSSRPMNVDNWKLTLKKAASLANPNLYKDLDSRVNRTTLQRAVPYVVSFAMANVLRNVPELESNNTISARLGKMRYNRAFEGRLPYSTLYLIATFIVFLAGASTWLLPIVLEFVTNLTGLALLFPEEIAMMMLISYFCPSVLAVFGLLFTWAYASTGVAIGAGLSLPTLLLIFFLLILYSRQRRQRYSLWDDWKRTYKYLRQSVCFSGPIRANDPLPCYDSWVDPTLYPSRPGATLEVLDEKHDLREKDGLLAVGCVFPCAVPFVHTNNQTNYKLACKTRVLLEVPEGSDDAWNEHERLLDQMGILPMEPGANGPVPSVVREDKDYIEPSKDDWFKRFPPHKQRRLKEWEDRVLCGDYKKSNLAYEGFVKREKIIGVTSQEYTPVRPRVIQGCSQLEKVITGWWFYIYSKVMKYVWHLKNYIWAASGATAEEYNEWFNYHVDRLGGVDSCHFIGTDFSKYDLTQGRRAKKREHKWYESIGFLVLPLARLIIKAREKLKVYGQGIKMTYLYRRQSGSNDTTTGNSKNTGEVIAGCFHSLGLTEDDFAIAVIGDDNFTIMTDRAWCRVGPTYMVEYAERLGFILKIQHSHNPTAVEFVSCRYFPVKNGYAIGKKPGRVLCKMGWMLARPNRSTEQWESLLKGSMLSYKATGMHVPFLRKYLEVCGERLQSVIPKIDADFQYRLTGVETHEVTADTWIAFEAVYGLGPDDEISFERELRATGRWPYMLDSQYVDLLYAIDSLM